MTLLDLTGVEAQGASVPDGTYAVVVDKAEVTPTKSGGEMIKVNLKVTDGPSAGRVIFDTFNIRNTNPQATQIGLSQLKGMMKAFGHKNPNRLETVLELIGLKGLVTTKTQEDAGYAPQARVKAYKPSLTATPVVGGAPGEAPKASNPF